MSAGLQKPPCVKPPRKFRGGQFAAYLVTVLHPVIFGLPMLLNDQPIIAATKKHPYTPAPSTVPLPPPRPPPQTQPKYTPASDPPDVQDAFVKALVTAGRCREHGYTMRGRGWPASAPLRQTTKSPNNCQRRHLHNAVSIRRPNRTRSPLSVDECLRMVDFYSAEFSTLSPRLNYDSAPPIFRSEEPSTLSIRTHTHNGVAQVPPDVKQELASRATVQRVRAILERSGCTHEEAWDAFQSLPAPGLTLLSHSSKRRLLQRLAVTKKKDQASMFRYLSIMDQMSAHDFRLDTSAWSTAIAFAGHGYSRITAASIESALLKWKEMETKAHVTSGHVTFNILFHLATKAERFALAEMIFKEMESRKLRLSRFGRVGLIYYHGMKGDGDGVRKAYRDFVEAGEIVDTIVMNCVIVSLLRAGELTAAEHVFERMKQILQKHTGRQIPNLDWREPRDLGRLLDRAAQQCRDKPEERQNLQDQQFLAPSPQTFAIFLEHHATKTGEIRRIASLVTEMQSFGVPVEGRIFVRIFKGFAYHGGIQYTAWTKARLHSVWGALLNALDQKLEKISLDRWLVVWIIRAFRKCFGHEQTLLIWEELRKRWKGDYRELGNVQDMLKNILSEAVKHAGNANADIHV